MQKMSGNMGKLKNEIEYCKYCYLHYDVCTCCDKCSALKGSCDCVPDSPTILSPSDSYKTFYKNPKLLRDLFGINSLDDLDKIVMRTYKKEFWPERLKI
jgi:hypothetical protein